MNTVICPYCHKPADLVAGQTLFPFRPDLAGRYFWVCTPCDARVGCHESGTKPMGRLANAQLRLAKTEAHRHFDPIWQELKIMTRSEAYRWLSKELGISRQHCHIGFFNITRCQRTVELCKLLIEQRKALL